MSQRLDIILFGATGLTGKNCIQYLHQLTKSNERSLTWGIAGRCKEKLVQIQKECSKSIGESLKDVPIFIADVNDGESLNKMTASAKVLINCIGPYQLYGEAVVLACLETCTHHIDVSGEPYYMENIYYKYNRLAKERGIYIISACGYDSVPADLGVVFMQQNFEGTLNSVEIYMSAYNKDKNGVRQLNYATWESAITGKENIENLISLRKKQFKKPLPKLFPKLPRRPSLFKSDVTNTWMKRFLGSDRSVIHRTQRYFHEHENARPVQVNVYEGVDSFVSVQFTKLATNITNFLLDYKFGKELVLKYPSFFSLGKFQTDSPTDELSNNIEYKFVLDGSGWDKNVDLKNRPNKRIICEMSGTNPGYRFTCVCVTLCAIIVLTETDNLPKEGGVYTPGVAFAKTSLMPQLIQHGLNFKMSSKI